MRAPEIKIFIKALLRNKKKLKKSDGTEMNFKKSKNFFNNIPNILESL